MTDDLVELLSELLDAYIHESSALNDPREPERYREWAEERVAKVERALNEAREFTA